MFVASRNQLKGDSCEHLVVPERFSVARCRSIALISYPAPSLGELTDPLNRIIRRITQQLTRQGCSSNKTIRPISTCRSTMPSISSALRRCSIESFSGLMPAAGYSPCVTPCRGHLQVPGPSQPLATERLSVTDEGKAALVPRPRVNLTRYHRVIARQLKAA